MHGFTYTYHKRNARSIAPGPSTFSPITSTTYGVLLLAPCCLPEGLELLLAVKNPPALGVGPPTRADKRPVAEFTLLLLWCPLRILPLAPPPLAPPYAGPSFGPLAPVNVPLELPLPFFSSSSKARDVSPFIDVIFSCHPPRNSLVIPVQCGFECFMLDAICWRQQTGCYLFDATCEILHARCCM